MTEDRRRERLRYRSWHRGTREMDLIMGKFADQVLPTLDSNLLDSFESMLDIPDPDLYDWVSGRKPIPDTETNPIVAMLVNTNFA